MKSILLIGGGGHCRSCIDVIESTKEYQIAGIVKPISENFSSVLGYPVVGSDADLVDLLRESTMAFLALGQIKSCELRVRFFNLLREIGAELPVIQSANARLSKHSKVGYGTILMHGVVVNANVRIGDNCIINTMALVEHDVEIGNHCHISTGARVNGGVKIGDRCFIGSGAILREGIQIGADSIVGAGQIVMKNIAQGSIIKDVGYD